MRGAPAAEGPILRNDAGGVTLALDAAVRAWLDERRVFLGRARRPFRLTPLTAEEAVERFGGG